MEMQDLGLYLGGAVLVLLLLFLAVIAARSMGGGIRGRRGQRLSISEFYDIDKARRLVLVKRDGVEHLLLVGPHQDVVIESGISVMGVGTGLGDELPHLRKAQKATGAAASENEPLESVRPVSTRMAPRPAVLSDRAPNLRNVEPEVPRLAAIRSNFDQE